MAEEPEAAELPHGWMRLVPYDWKTPLIEVSSAGLLVALFTSGQFARTLSVFFDLPYWVGLILTLSVFVIAMGLVLLIAYIRFRQPDVNFDTDQIRSGGRVGDIADITQAHVILMQNKRTLTLSMRFGVPKGPQVLVAVRRKWGELDKASGQRVAEVLRRSNVAMPISKDDPTGRFARFNFPTNVSKEDAIQTVLHPPKRGDAMPVPSPN